MRLMAKFTAIFTLVLFAGVAIIAWLSYRLVEDNARTFVLDQARLMMQAARSVRDYTTFQLKPLLTPEEQRNHTFLPQRVPAYAATEHFKYLREGLRDYSYKEASLNPTNPRDRAVDWEADIINAFRDKPEMQERPASATRAPESLSSSHGRCASSESVLSATASPAWPRPR
jgi:Protein of unknown function (DUF3365)